MGIFDQDNTSVIRNQPSQLFWNNGKIDRIITPIIEDRLTADKRDWSTRQFNKLTESPIGQLYSKAEQIPIVNFVLPSTEGLTNFVDNRSSAWNKATGALEAVPLLAGAGYKGFKALNKVVSSKFLDQANSIFKSLPNRQTMDYNNNIEALTALQKFSDEKGYGLKNVVHYAKDQNKTDAAIRDIMNRNNTFARGVSAPDKETAIKYLSEVPGETGGGRFGLESGEHALYTSNSLGTAEGYTYGNGFIGKLKLPTDYSSNNRLHWVYNNKELPNNVLKQEYHHQHSNPFSSEYGVIKKIADKNKIMLSNRSDENTLSRLGYDIWSRDMLLKELNDARSSLANADLPDIALFDRKVKSLSKRYSSQSELVVKNKFYDRVKNMSKNFQDVSNNYNHYVFQGNPGQKIGEVIDIKHINPDIWKQKSRAHEGDYSSGLSLAGFTPIIFTKPDSTNNIFNK